MQLRDPEHSKDAVVVSDRCAREAAGDVEAGLPSRVAHGGVERVHAPAGCGWSRLALRSRGATLYFVRRRADGRWDVAADRSPDACAVVQSRSEAEELALSLTAGGDPRLLPPRPA